MELLLSVAVTCEQLSVTVLAFGQVMGLWAGWKAMLWLALHGVSWKVVGGILLLLCCTPMILQALWPSNEYEINLGATLQYAQMHHLSPLRVMIMHPRA